MKSMPPIMLKDLLDQGLLEPGERLVSTSSTYPAEATITDDGMIEMHGERHTSPSAAATAVKACVGGMDPTTNGWIFWAVVRPAEIVRFDTIRKRLTINTKHSALRPPLFNAIKDTTACKKNVPFDLLANKPEDVTCRERIRVLDT